MEDSGSLTPSGGQAWTRHARGVGRPSTVAPYEPQVAQWLRGVLTSRAPKSCDVCG